MNDKVCHLQEVQREPLIEQHILKGIELFVEDIKSGYIKGIAIAAITRDDQVITSFDTRSYPGLIGAIKDLENRIMKSWDKNAPLHHPLSPA